MAETGQRVTILATSHIAHASGNTREDTRPKTSLTFFLMAFGTSGRNADEDSANVKKRRETT